MATMRIIVLFNLKPGKSKADYEQWARSTDLPIVNALPSIEGFRLFEATGVLGSETPSPFSYVEIIDVADMDRFGSDVASETMQRVAAEFNDWADPLFLTTREIIA